MNGGTMNGEDPTSPIAFERRYQGCEDPWGFATDAYEQHRYAQLLAAIGPGPFAAAFAFMVALVLAATALCGAAGADSGRVPLTRLSLGESGGWIALDLALGGQPGRWLIAAELVEKANELERLIDAVLQKHGP